MSALRMLAHAGIRISAVRGLTAGSTQRLAAASVGASNTRSARSARPSPHRSLSSKAPKKPTKIVGQELNAAIGGLEGWQKSLDRDCLLKKFRFVDFNECWSVMSRVALLAEKMNHHPKWTNVYGELKIELETHDVSGISDFDITMAKEIDAYVSAVKKPLGAQNGKK